MPVALNNCKNWGESEEVLSRVIRQSASKSLCQGQQYFHTVQNQPIVGRLADSHMFPGEDLERREIRLFKGKRNGKSK